ncbi:RTA1 like protein-domain-containing protein [Russula vinacea]|nr:RTA1 like protein-domain-containing protein [Russula vinacea]
MSSLNSTVNDQPQLQYNYIPTEWVGITFLSLFGLSTFVHTIQAFRSRIWWLFPKLIGWSGRLRSSQRPYLEGPYILQAVALVIAPTPLLALLGPQYSRLTPRRCNCLVGAFSTVPQDIIALVIQGVGGSIAAVAENAADSLSQANLGAHIALGGTAFQQVAIIVYCALAAEFLARHSWDLPIRRSAPVPKEALRGTLDNRLSRMLQALFIMTTFIMIRAIYRVIEFAGGWKGKVISTQWYFYVFDGIMICLAMFTLNLIHPGIYLQGDDNLSQTSPESTFMEYRLSLKLTLTPLAERTV